MTEQFHTACPECSTPLRLPDSSIGKRIQCPKCQTKFFTESDEQDSMELPADEGEAEILEVSDEAQIDEVTEEPETETANKDVAMTKTEPATTNHTVNEQTKTQDAASVVPYTPASGSSSSDRNLLFGVLAWQAGVITDVKLLDALKQWTFEKNKTLGEILIEQLALAESQREMLELLVDTHIRLRADPAVKNVA